MKLHFRILLSVILVLFISCSDDIPTTISNTSWENNNKYSQSFTEYGIKLTIDYDINSTITFNSETGFTYKQKYSVTMNNEVDCDSVTKTGTYTFDSDNGKVKLLVDEKITEAKFDNNKLTLYTENGNFVFSKK